MSLIDAHGRLFGRFNLIDLSIAAFLLVMLPVAYGVVRLFRPSTPHIDSVVEVAIGKEEWRIAGGVVVSAKLKVKGSGFNPLLRAALGRTPALAFVFENPNSADVVVGGLGPGRYDLVLFDGVQEVARMPGAVTIGAGASTSSVRIEGWLTGLDEQQATDLHEGAAFPPEARVYTVVALGQARPGSNRVTLPGGVVDLPHAGRVDRRVLIDATCDARADEEPCRVLGQSVQKAVLPPAADGTAGDQTLSLPGPSGRLRFVVTDVFPATPPRRARVQVRLTGGAVSEVTAGDRDALLDSRAAVVAAVGPPASVGGERAVTVTLTLGLDDSREGWRYRGQLITPGSVLTLSTDRYRTSGVVQAVGEPASPKTP